MADDCVCTNLLAIYNVLSTIANKLDVLNTRLIDVSGEFSGQNRSMNLAETVGYRLGVIGGRISGTNGYLSYLDDDLKVVSERLTFDGDSIAKILSDKGFYNEIVVESNNWAFCGHGNIGFVD